MEFAVGCGEVRFLFCTRCVPPVNRTAWEGVTRAVPSRLLSCVSHETKGGYDLVYRRMHLLPRGGADGAIHGADRLPDAREGGSS